MRRREFLKSAAIAPVGANFLFPVRRSDRPNLLFVWTDQQRPDTLAVYGNSRIQAPNLNKLASESIVFERAYVSQPVCTPSRSTVLTGLWPHQNGCTENNLPLAENIPCLPEILADPEYRTGYFGKWHLGDELFAQRGFEEWESIEDIYQQYFRPGRDRSRRSSYHHFLVERGYKPNEPDGTFGRLYAAKLPIEHCKPKFLEMKACDFLRRRRSEPFILHVNFLEPHPPYYGPLNGEYRAEDMELEPNYTDPLEEDEPLNYRLKRDRARTARPEGMDLRTDDGWRRLKANYWGSVTHVDRSVGAILKTLEDLGLADRTIVVFTSDHGEMLGAHGMLAKSVMYEEAVRIPWLMRVPALGRRHRLIRGRFSHIDLIPTVLDLMGRPMPGRFPGRSLLPEISWGSPKPANVFIQWNATLKYVEGDLLKPEFQSETIQRAVRTNTRTVISPDGWKLCLSDADKNQLFDLNRDPYETKNIFYTGQHRDVIRRLTSEIHEWQRSIKDRVAVAEAG
ncbi:MAG: sulfatase-like hydrolase/transferase [Acidobacteria bacterium]|nr:sulfatase-like hydrolase/transferase [Acidobacteriota bacterium]